jgi:hypothetical protein
MKGEHVELLVTMPDGQYMLLIIINLLSAYSLHVCLVGMSSRKTIDRKNNNYCTHHGILRLMPSTLAIFL